MARLGGASDPLFTLLGERTVLLLILSIGWPSSNDEGYVEYANNDSSWSLLCKLASDIKTPSSKGMVVIV
jgi:hypothetical protein